MLKSLIYAFCWIGSRSHEDLKRFVSEKKSQDFAESLLHDLKLEIADGPVIITEQNFVRSVRDGVVFVKFLVPWCKHCRRLAPIWEQLYHKFAGQQNVKIAKVDCSKYESLCNKQQVCRHLIFNQFCISIIWL